MFRMGEKERLTRMADLLRAGATMLSDSCPECGSPLFRMPSGEIWCPSCEKRVLIIKKSEKPSTAVGLLVLDGLEDSLVSKLKDIQARIDKEKDIEELGRLSTILSRMLEALERLRRIRSSQS